MLKKFILTHTVDTTTDLSSGIFNMAVSSGMQDSYQAFISSFTLSALAIIRQ
jgi:hypothetical protein